tara:strand:- start:519 stop:965 length:447 start_codon:yes stop_codon:yes gene_type:complete
MVLWVDKHRPKSLDALDYHQPLSKQLKRLVAAGDFPHMLMYGPSGAGKKTRIMALLREMYGPGAERLKVEHRSFKVGTNTVELSILTSPHHIELNPSDAGIRDRGMFFFVCTPSLPNPNPAPTSSEMWWHSQRCGGTPSDKVAPPATW